MCFAQAINLYLSAQTKFSEKADIRKNSHTTRLPWLSPPHEPSGLPVFYT
ncbi:MAG: hypothetical protein ACJAVM_002893 [Sulfitobacter sp.]